MDVLIYYPQHQHHQIHFNNNQINQQHMFIKYTSWRKYNRSTKCCVENNSVTVASNVTGKENDDHRSDLMMMVMIVVVVVDNFKRNNINNKICIFSVTQQSPELLSLFHSSHITIADTWQPCEQTTAQETTTETKQQHKTTTKTVVDIHKKYSFKYFSPNKRNPHFLECDTERWKCFTSSLFPSLSFSLSSTSRTHTNNWTFTHILNSRQIQRHNKTESQSNHNTVATLPHFSFSLFSSTTSWDHIPSSPFSWNTSPQ